VRGDVSDVLDEVLVADHLGLWTVGSFPCPPSYVFFMENN
jgi:hypothetical protein